MKSINTDPRFPNKDQKDKNIDFLNSGITMKLLDKYKPKKSYVSIENLKNRKEKKRVV